MAFNKALYNNIEINFFGRHNSKNYIMKFPLFLLFVSLFSFNFQSIAGPSVNQAATPAPNGLTIPKGYRNWKLIGVSHRTDKNSLRAILGNRKAHQATLSKGKWNWPEGTILAKLVWNDSQHPAWPDATVPGSLSHIEFMVKDGKKFAATGGWGFARWLGMKLDPYPNDGSECYACHSKVKNDGYVFTRPARLP